MSNGSEHLDERCVHAVDGPDWAGLRELYPAEVDYKALVEQARGFVPIMESGNLILTLADAVEALAAENKKLRKAKDHVTSNYLLASQRKRDAEAENENLREQIDAARDSAAKKGWNLQNERDEWRSIALRERAEAAALQARLDAMTTDFRLRRTGVVKGKVVEVEPFYEQRLVGPWTVVPEGDGNV